VNAMNSKIADDMSNTMQKMIVSCDAFGSEVEMMYDKWYPVDSSAAQLDSIKILENKFQTLSTSYTSRKAVLNKLIAKNIEARRLDEGLRRCQQMKKLFKDEGGAYYASAFVYNLQKKYPLAINELEQQISLEKNNDLKLFIALMRRKAQRNL
jgi:tetratricopeptide (TPR) repeat protein